MKSKVKKMAKDGLILGATGVGLGLMSGVMGDAGADAAPLGKISKGLGTASSVVMMGHTMDILSDSLPKKKKKGGWY